MLRQFLRNRHVEFDDLGVDWPAEPTARTLYIAENPPVRPSRIASTDGWRLISFLPSTPGEDDLPSVYRSVDTRGGIISKVLMPGLIEHLSDDPRSERTLGEIFQSAFDFHVPVSVPDPDPADSP